ncbi:hypothetical protein E7T06_16300 [Deinococcus sp. Arct2-2]|uniref:hypothetical protein n=1 Tax=Deinococcus sp. Arct2-2 TaxID=2568653 RepID=UPI0010A3165A|nr:hypothetical protein [Deinococcus sp. Arct2-2]THF68489.1 hypothetical protein E7T06_16300 [Deinococcus sp. Arct2-2]
MRSTWLLAALLLPLLSAPATAATVPLRSLLVGGTQSTGSLTLDKNTFLVSKCTGETRDLLLGVTQLSLAKAGRIDQVAVLAQREYLTPKERMAFNGAVLNVAFKCFNLRTERKAAILTWLDRQNASALRNVSAEFGPMILNFERQLEDDGTFWTSVSLSRSGVPGVSPWINYCTP